MKRTRHSPEQIIRKLREADRMLSEGQTIAEVCQSLTGTVKERSWRRPSTAGGTNTAG